MKQSTIAIIKLFHLSHDPLTIDFRSQKVSPRKGSSYRRVPSVSIFSRDFFLRRRVQRSTLQNIFNAIYFLNIYLLVCSDLYILQDFTFPGEIYVSPCRAARVAKSINVSLLSHCSNFVPQSFTAAQSTLDNVLGVITDFPGLPSSITAIFYATL